MRNQNESLDASAKTVEEAIAQGLDQLGVSRDEVEIQVLHEGKRGIFGLGAEDAVVRLTVKPQPAPAAPVSTPIEATEAEPTAAVDEAIPETSKKTVAEPAPQPESVAAKPKPEPELSAPEKETISLEPDSDPVTIAKGHLEQLLKYMGIQATIEVRTAPELVEGTEEPPTVLDITGSDLGILIGRRSETLQALQYLVRLMTSKEMTSWQRIVVDVESYRSRRRSSLQKMANRMAERAVANRERVVLEAMTPYERRIIHIALRDHPTVYTKSIGRDNNRKVTIVPK